MHVLAVVQREARPGQAEALIEAARARWGNRAGWGPGRRAARLLQSAAVPERLLTLIEWDSPAAFRAARPAGWTSPLDALCTAPAATHLFAPHWYLAHLAHPPTHVTAVLYHTPPAARAATLRFLAEDTRDAVRALPGLVLQVLYEDTQDPTQFLTLAGWSSAAASAAFERQLVPVFQAQRRVLGFTVERFLGRLRLDLERWGSTSGSPHAASTGRVQGAG